MAGRGTDIILGGNLKYLINDLVKQIIYQLINTFIAGSECKRYLLF
jgi:preprotein translocase subunit SecA